MSDLRFPILIQNDLKRMSSLLKEIIVKQEKFLPESLCGLLTKGKKLRPLLFLLSLRMLMDGRQGRLTKDKISMATGVELFHLASLIHDDIVDNADKRRGHSTANYIKGGGYAVLLGDYQLINALDLIFSNAKTPRILKNFIQTARKMCVGELEKATEGFVTDKAILLKRYFKNIEQKTGTLFGLSCSLAAAVLEKTKKKEEQLYLFGFKLGQAFQIVDDILDFTGSHKMAEKTVYNDILNGNFTLPIIYALADQPKDNKVWRAFDGKSEPGEWVEEITGLVLRSGGLIQAHRNAIHLKEEALLCLKGMADNSFHDSLVELSEFMIQRSF